MATTLSSIFAIRACISRAAFAEFVEIDRPVVDDAADAVGVGNTLTEDDACRVLEEIERQLQSKLQGDDEEDGDDNEDDDEDDVEDDGNSAELDEEE